MLDLASGPGTLTGRLAEAAGPTGLVVAVDLAPGMLRLLPPGPVAVRSDVERLGLAGRAFDAVACGHGLHLCPDLAAAAAEARRVLRDGGRLAASLPGPAPGPDAAGEALEQALASLPGPPHPDPPPRGGREVADALLAEGFTAADFEAVAELATHAGPAEMVDHAFRWWSWARRLDLVPAAERARLREEAERCLRARVGGGPIEVPGSSWVVWATA